MTQAHANILVIDDEPQIRKLLRISLVAQGYAVLEAASAQEGLNQAALQRPDIVVLDLGLPDADGQQLLVDLRTWSSVPVLVLSARDTDSEKVKALDNGANDYVTKPFSIQEFLARIRALLRQGSAHNQLEVPHLQAGALRIDFAYRKVYLDEQEISLTRKEYSVLALLAQHPGRVITQKQLLKDIWGPNHEQDSHYLRIVIRHLRQKLQEDAAHPRFIRTESGVGYRLNIPST